MSTHSFIGMVKEDDTVIGIYCHFDGYKDHHAPVLTKYYTTADKVKELIQLGSICSLAKDIGEKHDPHLTVHDDWVRAYVRDYGYDPSKKEHLIYASESEALSKCFRDTGSYHAYLFKNGKWFYASSSDNCFKPIEIPTMRKPPMKVNNQAYFIDVLYDHNVNISYRIAIEKFINDSRPGKDVNADPINYWKSMFAPLEPDLIVEVGKNSDDDFDNIFNLGRLIGSGGAEAKCCWLEVNGVQFFWANKTPKQIAESMALFAYGLI